jgi:hypothetical protein
MSSTETIEPISSKAHPVGNGLQRLYRFENGFGASVVQFFVGPMGGSYGAELGLWELAVIRWHGDDFRLTYDTSITDDVLGRLTEDEVQDYLRQIRDLPAVSP